MDHGLRYSDRIAKAVYGSATAISVTAQLSRSSATELDDVPRRRLYGISAVAEAGVHHLDNNCQRLVRCLSIVRFIVTVDALEIFRNCTSPGSASVHIDHTDIPARNVRLRRCIILFTYQ